MAYMSHIDRRRSFWFSRRVDDRVPVESFCTEYVGERERHGLVVDLSETGLRVQRPLLGAGAGRVVQLEFELPGYDEIIWARGEICFDQLWRVPRPRADGGLAGVLRTSGVRVVAAAGRHLRLLRDYVRAMRAIDSLDAAP